MWFQHTYAFNLHLLPCLCYNVLHSITPYMYIIKEGTNSATCQVCYLQLLHLTFLLVYPELIHFIWDKLNSINFTDKQFKECSVQVIFQGQLCTKSFSHILTLWPMLLIKCYMYKCQALLKAVTDIENFMLLSLNKLSCNF